MNQSDYKAFITYSHDDSKAAGRLQRSLEAYRVPARLVGKQTGQGKITARIGPIFRDKDELPAGSDLNQSLKAALANSEYLIVICSPSARKSRWVNLEIESFRKAHGDNKILCYIVDGEPFAADSSTKGDLECFPKALGYLKTDRENKATIEPVAADIRPGTDGRKLARQKIISGLLGLGLDEIIQRDAQKYQRKMVGIAVVSFVGMLVMAVLSFIAVDARNSEELRRAEAEDLIEFMLSDLRERLDAVGRLDVLESVGVKAIEYYSNVDLADYNESSLGRRARAFHLLGEMDDLRGNTELARNAFNEAYQTTAELVLRAPRDGDRIFDHAQSVFWVGYLDWRLGHLDTAEVSFIEYMALAKRLVELDSTNLKWLVELSYANSNMGIYELDTGTHKDAIRYFEKNLSILEEVTRNDPENSEWLWELAQANAWLSDATEYDGAQVVAHNYRLAEIQIYRKLLALDPSNQRVNSALLISYHALGTLFLNQGKVSLAVDNLLEARKYGDQLLTLEPENTLFIRETAGVYSSMGDVFQFVDSPDIASEHLGKAEQMIAPLVEKDSSVLEWNTLLYKTRVLLGDHLMRNGAIEESVVLLSTIVEELASLVNDSPDVHEIRGLFAEAHFYLGRAFELNGDSEAAREQNSLAISEFLLINTKMSPRMKAILSLAYESSGDSAQADVLATYLASINYRHPGYIDASSGN